MLCTCRWKNHFQNCLAVCHRYCYIVVICLVQLDACWNDFVRILIFWYKNIKKGFGGHRHLWLQNLNIFGDGATFFIFGKHEGMPAASIISTIEGMLGYYPSIANLLSCVMNVMWSKKWVGRSSKHVTLARFLREKDDKWVALPLTYYCTIDNCRDNLCVRRYLQLRPLVSPYTYPVFLQN